MKKNIILRNIVLLLVVITICIFYAKALSRSLFNNSESILTYEVNSDINEKYVKYNSIKTTDDERTEIIKYIQLNYPELNEEYINNKDVKMFYIKIMRCGDGVPRPSINSFER